MQQTTCKPQSPCYLATTELAVALPLADRGNKRIRMIDFSVVPARVSTLVKDLVGEPMGVAVNTSDGTVFFTEVSPAVSVHMCPLPNDIMCLRRKGVCSTHLSDILQLYSWSAGTYQAMRAASSPQPMANGPLASQVMNTTECSFDITSAGCRLFGVGLGARSKM